MILCHESTLAEKDLLQVRMIRLVEKLNRYAAIKRLQWKSMCSVCVCFWPVAVFDLALPKKKIKEERRKKKMRPIKMESEEVCDVQMSAASVNPGLADVPVVPPQSVKEE